MKKVLTMTIIAVIGLAAYGCTKTEKINAAAANAQCNSVKSDRTCCGSTKCAARKVANAKLAATGDSSDCPLWGTPECPLAAAKAKPAAAGDAKSCCANKAKTKPSAAGDAKSCCAKKAAVKPAATSNKNKANCDPADCGKWKKGAGSGCPFSGS